MKKLLLVLVLLLSILFYAIATNYEMVGVNKSDGLVVNNNDIQTNLYSSNLDKEVKSNEVHASEGIYKRLNTIYYGDTDKVKVNNSYPMYINNGEAIKLLSGDEVLISNSFEFVKGYKDLIVNNGLTFNNEYERSDVNDYILVHLSNNLYVNTKDMHVETYMNSYKIPANSILYLNVDYINYYTLKGDNTFVGSSITDIDEDTYVRIGDTELLYSKLLLNLGETVEYHQADDSKTLQEQIEEMTQEEETNASKGSSDAKKKSNKNRGEGELSDRTEDSSNSEEKSSSSAEPVRPPQPEQGKKPEKNAAAERPEEAEPTPDTPLPPDPYDIVYPDWELPEVSPGSLFIPGVYSLDMSYNIQDYAGVIYGGLVFEVFNDTARINKDTTSYYLDGSTLVEYKDYSQGATFNVDKSNELRGNLYYIRTDGSGVEEYFLSSDVNLTIVKRATYQVTSGDDVEILMSGLTPLTDYLISGYFKCKDKYDRPYEYVDDYGVTHTQIDFLSPKYFKTKDVTELGDIIFTEFDISNIFGEQIQINDIGFATNSDMDAVASLSRIQYKITKGSEVISATILPSKQLATLMQLQKISFVYRNNIQSDSEYLVEFTCFDMFGNELSVKGNSVLVKTCKKVPTSLITVDYKKDEQDKEILGEILLSATFNNPDGVPYKNLRFIIVDKKDGNVYKYYDEESGELLDYIPYKVTTPPTVLDLDGFTEGHDYVVKLLAEMDNGDGQGEITREISIKEFSTSPISLLGSLYLNVFDVSNKEIPEERYKRAIFNISLSNSTNSQLLNYIDHLTMHFDGGIEYYTFSEEEIAKLKNKETITLDTDDFIPSGLIGNTTYRLSFNAQHDITEEEKYDIGVVSSLRNFTTIRTPVKVMMTTPVTAPGYLNTSIFVEDVDDVIVGDNAILKIYEVTGDKLILTASFLIDKTSTEYKQIILSSDSSLSTDGVSYDIKQGATYRFIFQAEEANTEAGTVTDYVLASKEVTVNVGVKGRIYLKSLNENFNNFQQVEYIKTSDTGTYQINLEHGGFNSNTDEFFIDFMYDYPSTRSNQWMYGIFETNKRVTAQHSGTSKSVTVYYGNTSVSVSDVDRYNVLYNKDGLYVNDVFKKAFQNFSTTWNIYLFNLNYNNSASVQSYSANEYFYSSYLKRNGEKILDLVPCYRKADGEIGVFDLANNIFYPNLGTGKFTKGPDVNPTPEGKQTMISTIGLNVAYPDNWMGNNDLYVDVTKDNDSSYKDTISFAFDRTSSTSTRRVYKASNLEDYKGKLNTPILILEYNELKETFDGYFDYVVDRNDNFEEKYNFNLYTVLLDNIYLSTSTATLDPASKTILPGGVKFTENIDLSINYPSNVGENYSFYIDIFNEELSLDVPYETLSFEYDKIRSDVSGAYKVFDVRKSSDTSTILYSSFFMNYDEASDSYKGTLKDYVFDVLSDTSKTYSFTIYRKVVNDLLYVPLDGTSFSTEKQIYTISNIEEFFAVKTSNRKYVVIDDLYYDDDTVHSATGGKWGSTTFNAQIDFQGFSLTYKGNNALIYKTSTSASISNAVLKITSKLRKNTTLTQQGNNNRGAGTFIDNNYGTLSNIYVEYYQEQPEDIAAEGAEIYYGPYYWSDEADHASNPSHQYAYLHAASSICINNYGTIENFVVDAKTVIRSGYNSGVVIAENYNILRNGYVFSSANDDYKVRAYVYRNSSYSTSLKDYDIFGIVCGRTHLSGVYAGITENIYALGNIENKTGTTNESIGIISGRNNSIVRNTFSNGNVVTDSKANTAYGPNVGYTVSSANRNPNNNYISTYSYNNSINTPTSVVALRSNSWVNGVLNVNYDEFNVNEMIIVGCYPQVNMSDVMPSQLMLELPAMPSKDEVDVIFSEVYKLGQPGNEEIDRLINERRTGNEIGDLITGKVDGSDFTSNSQIVQVFVTDKSASQIHSLSLTDSTMVNTCLVQTMDGTGISVLYLEVYNPSQALSKYTTTGVYFKDYAGEKTYPPIPINRELDVSYTKMIMNVEDWKDVVSNPTQNHRLGADLDFAESKMENIFINATFTGTLDGRGHTIRNIEYDSKAFADIFPAGTDGSYSAKIGLMKSLNGTVKDLTLENINFEGGEYVGALAATATGGVIENVYVKNSFLSGTNRIGGLLATADYTDIYNSGVSETKLLSVGGEYANEDEQWKNGIGGVVSYLKNANNLERIYANNVYIEYFGASPSYSVTGGLVAYVNGSANKITGSYATGVINTSSYAAGGLIGMNYQSISVDYCYSDVDVNSYYYNAGGLVGIAYADVVSENPLLSFGDVHSKTILEEDGRQNTFKIIGNNYNAYNNTTKKLNGIYYDKATLISNTSIIPTETSFDGSLISSEDIYNYLGSYFKINENADKGVLPKLVDPNDANSYLPYQIDNYISAFDSEITVSITEDETNKSIDVLVYHTNDISIDGVYTDFEYINSNININDNSDFYGVKSLTNRTALNYVLEKSPFDGGTKFTLSHIAPNCFYDNYDITAIQYTKNDETNYLKLNYRINCIGQSFKTITSLDDYNEYVGKSIAENFYLSTDIDLGASSIDYADENKCNLVINRLIGTKGDENDYLAKKDNPSAKPYYTISNLELNGVTNVNKEHGWIYSNDVYYFKSILSELKNISFDNIKINSTNQTGVVGSLQGTAKGLTIENTSISNTHANRAFGFIRVSRGFVGNVYINNFDGSSKNFGSGIMVGYFIYGNLGIGVDSIYCINSKINSSSYYTGVIGYSLADYPYYKPECYISNIDVLNTTISSTSYSASTIVGAISANTKDTVSNCNVYNSTASGTYYVGGVIGFNNSNGNTTVNNSYVLQSTIKATSTGDCYAGGIVGYQSGNIHNNTVKDSTVIGYGSRVGGITGYCNYAVTRTGDPLNRTSFEDLDDEDLFGYVLNTKVYGKDYVGGLVGYGNNNVSRGVVKDTEIKGNRYVGGICGADYSYYVSQSIVYNTTITPWRDSKEASYGPAYSSDQNSFGGISGNSTRILNCQVENSFVGGENVVYSGGLQGLARISTADSVTSNCSVENVVVIGKNSVGGLFGYAGGSSSYKVANFNNLYSNAFVYGDDFVGGIAGRLCGIENTSGGVVTSYSPTPLFENCFFTGSLTSKETAGAVFGRITGNSEATQNMFRFVSSFPSFIKAKKVSPVFCDYDGTEFAYLWDRIVEDTSDMAVGIYAGTRLYLCSDDSDTVETTMYNFVNNSSDFEPYLGNVITEGTTYKKYLGSTIKDVYDNFKLGVAGDPFIAMYNSIDDFKNNFYNYGSLDTLTESKVGSSYRFIKYRDMSNFDYMPFNYTNSTNPEWQTPQYLNFSLQDGDNKFIGNRYHSIKNPFDSTEEYDSFRLQQGVGIPGTEKDTNDNNWMSNVHDLYRTGGVKATGIGTRDSQSKKQDDINPIYRYLPSEYQQVEYIKTSDTGTYQINLEHGGFNSNTDEFFIDFMYDYPSTRSNQWMYGIFETNKRVTAQHSGTSKSVTVYYGNTSVSVSDVNRYNVLYNKDGLYVNDVFKKAFQNFSTTWNIYLFNLNYNNSASVQSYSANEYFYSSYLKRNGEKILDLVPCYRKADGEIGVYDLINNTFYTNKGSGKFTYGNEIGPDVDFVKYTFTYPSDIDKANIDIADSLLNALSDTVTAKLTINGIGSSPIVIDLSKDTKTISFDYNYTDTLSATLDYTKDGNTVTFVKDVLFDTNKAITLYKDNTYYIYNSHLYNQNGVIDDTNSYVNIYDDKILRNDGNIFKLDDLTTSIGTASTSVLSSPVPLYSLEYNGKHVDTYGSYSVIDSKETEEYRIFSASGNLIAVNSNTTPESDPIYASYSKGDSTILMLSKDTKVYSIGTKDIIDKLEGFSNNDIRQISTNLHNDVSSTNTYVGFVYANGSAVIYNINTGKRVNGSGLTGFTNSSPTLSTFLTNSLKSVFSFSSSREELSGKKKEADSVANFLSTSGLSLNDVVEYAKEDGDKMISIVGSIKNNDETIKADIASKEAEKAEDKTNAVELPNLDIKGNDISIDSNKEKLEESKENDNIAVPNVIVDNSKDLVTEETNEEGTGEESLDIPNTIEINNEGLEKTEEKGESTLIMDNSISDEPEFITVYNGESEEFDIVDANKLLEDPENVEAENVKVVDKSTLKALYNALGESKDNTTRRGIVIYTAIAIVIVLLLIPVVILRSRLGKKHKA